MIHLACKVPHTVHLAFSGGVDSLVAAHFFANGNRDVRLLHFNHGCEHSNLIEQQCRDTATKLGLPIQVGTISDPTPPPRRSLEDHWRRERYRFLRQASEGEQFVTCHHLDDAVETWVWSSLHGKGEVIPVQRGQAIRPFLLTEKQSLIDYASRHGIEPVDDPYNRENHLIRNYIRSNIMHHAYYVNPGLKKVIRKKYLNHEDSIPQGNH